jgi:hypothetical protein
VIQESHGRTGDSTPNGDLALDHGFRRLKGGMSGHVQYEGAGIKITLPGHGSQDLTKKHVALILRALGGAGFDRERVRRELGG